MEATLAELRAQGVTRQVPPPTWPTPIRSGARWTQVRGALGEIDVLVNNAGVLIARPFEELTLEDWDVTMATNLRSLYLMTRAVLPAMRRRRQGRHRQRRQPRRPKRLRRRHAPTPPRSTPCWDSAAR